MKILTATALLLAISFQAVPTLAKSRPIKSYIIGDSGEKIFMIRTCTRDYGSSVNIRSGAGKGYQAIRQVKSGTAINVTREMQGNDGFTWNKVDYKGVVGWVRGDYLCDIPFG
jgi:uncharacterized protein YgiM (DUF1202 family)